MVRLPRPWDAVPGATKYHSMYSDDDRGSWHGPVDDHTNIQTTSITFDADNAKNIIVGVRAGNDQRLERMDGLPDRRTLHAANADSYTYSRTLPPRRASRSNCNRRRRKRNPLMGRRRPILPSLATSTTSITTPHPPATSPGGVPGQPSLTAPPQPRRTPSAA